MARSRNGRRRRRGRYSFLLKLLSFFVILGAIFAAVTLFFKADRIVVSGNERYSAAEIVEASGVSEGDNLYLLNKYAVKERIFAALPYVEEVAINRALPDTLVIEVRESAAAAAVESGGALWLIDGRGKLLERTEVPPQGCPVVRGETLLEPDSGGQMDFGEDAAYRASVLLTLLRAAEEKNMRAAIGTIELGDDTALSFTYLDRFTVQLPWTSDVAYKLDNLVAVVSRLEVNETGRIDLMKDGKASFIPT